MKPNPYLMTAAAVVAASGLIGLWAYGQLPEGAVIATHFNAAGEANGSAPKAIGLAIGPAVGAGVVALLAVLPRLSRQREALEKARGPYGLVMVGVSVLLLLAQAGLVARALGLAIDPIRWLLSAVGLLLALIGNVLGKVRRNEVFGVRTPWTLMDPTVWDRTQRFTGRLMVAGGLVLAAVGFSPLPPRLAHLAILACALIPALAGVIYSWAIFKAPAKTG